MVPLGDMARRFEKIIVDNSPVILTAIGVTGAITTAYLTGKATVKATRIIDELESPGIQEVEPLLPREKLAITWKLYIPAMSSAVITVAAIISANKVGSRRAAALAAVYSISEKAFDEYKEKVIEKLGDKKERDIRDEIAQDRVTRNPVENREVIITGNGSVLCQDAFSGRYFLCDMETLRSAENDINHQIIHNSYASLSDFYHLIGLPITSVSDDVGWNADKLLDLKISATLTEGNKKPCVCIDYKVAPVRHYDRLS